MPSPTSSSGRAAEDFVVQYLKKNSFKVIERNVVISSVGELDIVATSEGVLCFIEVRSRRSDRLGHPYETVGTTKQNKIRKLASLYMARKKLDLPARFDVASVTWKSGEPLLEYFEDAFE